MERNTFRWYAVNDIQAMAERLARLTERIAVLETAQSDATATGERVTLNANTTVAANYCVILAMLDVPTGFYLAIASDGSLVLVG